MQVNGEGLAAIAQEPSAEQLREADEFGSGFGLVCGDEYQLTERQLARLIGHVRGLAIDECATYLEASGNMRSPIDSQTQGIMFAADLLRGDDLRIKLPRG